MNTTRVVPWDQEPPPESTRIGQIEIAVREAAPQWGHEIRPCLAPLGAGPLRAAIIGGSLLAALGLGWIAGSILHGFFPPDLTSPPFEQNFNASARAFKSDFKSDKETIVGTSKTSRDATPGEANAGWVVTAAGYNGGHETSPGAAQQVIPSPSPTSSTVQHHPPPQRPAPSVVDGRGKILPAPETRPTTVQGWVIRDVAGGTAVLEGPNGVWRTKPGEMVPGVGRVDFIVRWGSRWIVGTSRGLITTP
jgi:hypothetical protein